MWFKTTENTLNSCLKKFICPIRLHPHEPQTKITKKKTTCESFAQTNELSGGVWEDKIK